MFLGGIMLSFIKQYKVQLLLLALVFTPLAKWGLGLFGIVSQFVNWGILIMIILVLVAMKVNREYDLSGFNPFQSNNEEDNDPFN
jgi:predicted ferric reductase